MLTYGPDLNLSVAGATAAQVIDIGKKLTLFIAGLASVVKGG
jgi:hypothetical protein